MAVGLVDVDQILDAMETGLHGQEIRFLKVDGFAESLGMAKQLNIKTTAFCSIV
jgi:hypothetical protein